MRRSPLLTSLEMSELIILIGQTSSCSPLLTWNTEVPGILNATRSAGVIRAYSRSTSAIPWLSDTRLEYGTPTRLDRSLGGDLEFPDSPLRDRRRRTWPAVSSFGVMRTKLGCLTAGRFLWLVCLSVCLALLNFGLMVRYEGVGEREDVDAGGE